MNSAKARALLVVLADVLLPLVGYVVLHQLGFSDFWALTLAGALTAAYALARTIRRRRLDAVGTLVVLEIALSAVLLVLTRDARVVLLKPSLFTAVAGLYLLHTCFVGRAFTFDSSKPMAGRGDPQREQALDDLWETRPDFRHLHRMITGTWAVLWLVESAVRALIVLHDPVSQSVWTSQIPGIAAVLLGVAYTRTQVPKLRRIVDQQQAVAEVR